MEDSVATVIFNDDKSEVLLVKRRDVPVWVLPGGGIEPNESAQVAALREGEEETGFKLKLMRKVALYTPLNRLANTTHFFEATITSGLASPNAEASDVRFFPVGQLPYHMPPPYSDWIHDALTHSQEIKKTIDSVNYRSLFKFVFQHPILVARFFLARLGYPVNR